MIGGFDTPRLVAATALLAGLIAGPAPPAAGADETAAVFAGRPVVVSGDTLRIGSVRLRLAGIEAPDGDTGCTRGGAPFDCGRIAATALLDLTAGAEVRCREVAQSPGGGIVARCEAGGYDLSEGMTYTGWARAWPRDGNRYRAFEDHARERGHGLWRNGFTPPVAWRR
jgi:endonuclease YncB( thermonuclease family)